MLNYRAHYRKFEEGINVTIPTLNEEHKVFIGTMLHAMLRGNEEYKNNGIALDIGEKKMVNVFIGRETKLFKYLKEYGFRKLELPQDKDEA